MHSREGRQGAHLIVHHVAEPFAEHLLARARVQVNRDLIPHGSGRHENCRFLAEGRRGLLLEPAHRWIFSEDVVTDFSFGHRAAHSGRRLGERVRSEINGRHLRAPLAVL